MLQNDLLSEVVAALESRKGDLKKLAIDSGISYDTVLRIKNGEGDPGYSKVMTLAKHLGVRETDPEPQPTQAGEASHE